MALMSRDLIESGSAGRTRRTVSAKLLDDPEIVSVAARRNEQLARFGIMRFGDERAHLILPCGRYQRTGIGGASSLGCSVGSRRRHGVDSSSCERRTSPALAFYQATSFPRRCA